MRHLPAISIYGYGYTDLLHIDENRELTIGVSERQTLG